METDCEKSLYEGGRRIKNLEIGNEALKILWYGNKNFLKNYSFYFIRKKTIYIGTALAMIKYTQQLFF